MSGDVNAAAEGCQPAFDVSDCEARTVRVGTTREERAELREVMAILHRVSARLGVLGVHYVGRPLVTEARLLDEALERIGEVVAPGTSRKGES